MANPNKIFLEKLCEWLNLQGCLLTTLDGEAVDSNFSADLKIDDAAPPAAIIAQLFNDLVNPCKYTHPEMLVLDGHKEKVICVPVKPLNQLLFLFAQTDVNIGMIRMVLQESLEALTAKKE